MKKLKKSRLKSVLLRWFIVFFALFTVFCIILIRARPIVISYAQSQAKALMILAFDSAVSNSISKLAFTYDDIAVISRNGDNSVSSIEIDYQKLNLLRAEISQQITKEALEKSDNVLSIPLGTLLGSEYTTGYGPAKQFRMKFSQIPMLDFSSRFTSAGINSIFHQIIIKADLSCGIIMLGADKSFSISLSAIVAQTVISGIVPGSFTNVVETPGSNIADDIFNFSN